ncbi:MAG: hypothetical protein ABSA96_13265 [Candidatus Acidiferrales bacterium]|jgi:hypothetical protein
MPIAIYGAAKSLKLIFFFLCGVVEFSQAPAALAYCLFTDRRVHVHTLELVVYFNPVAVHLAELSLVLADGAVIKVMAALRTRKTGDELRTSDD